MKQSLLFVPVYALIILLINGCCPGVDCAGSGGDVALRLLKNGVVATGGPGSIVDPQFIYYYPEGHDFLTNPVSFPVDSQSITIFVLTANHDYILVLEEYGIDTISVTSEPVGKSSCGCQGYKITSVIYNGEVICVGECESLIDVEI